VSRGLDDRQFFLTYGLVGGAEQTLATRVRLAKASIYFVTVTLPPIPHGSAWMATRQARAPSLSSLSISPANLTGPHVQMTMGQVERTMSSSRAAPPQTVPPSPFYHQQGSPYGYAPHAYTSVAARKAAEHTQQPLMPPQAPTTAAPSMATLQPTAEATGMVRGGDPFTPQIGHRRLSHPAMYVSGPYPVGPSRQVSQLPYPFPSGHHGAPQSGPSSSLPSHVLAGQHRQQMTTPASVMSASSRRPPTMDHQVGRPRRDTLGRQLSSDVEEGEDDAGQRSPRKRRRLDIGDVLQK